MKRPKSPILLSLIIVVTFVVILFLIFAVVYVRGSNVHIFGQDPEMRINRLTSNDRYVAFGANYVAFGPNVKRPKPKIYVFDLKDNVIHRLFSNTEGLYDVKFSRALENVIYVSSSNQERDKDKVVSTSWKCDLNTKSCDKILSDNAWLSAPLELSNGQLLYVRSVASYRRDAFAPKVEIMVFRDHDFYTYDKKNGLSKISDFGVYNLDFVHLVDGQLIFMAGGPINPGYGKVDRFGRYWVGHGGENSQDGKSEIYSLDLIYKNKKYSVSGNLGTPFVERGKIFDSQPSAISHPPLITLSSGYNNIKDKKIVLYDYLEKKVLHVISSKENVVSNPSISPSGIVFYVEADVESMSLHKFNFVTGTESTVVSRAWKDIDELSNSIELK